MMAEQFRRRLMGRRQDIDCGYITITTSDLEWDGNLTLVRGTFDVEKISRIVVNGEDVAVGTDVHLAPGDVEVMVYYRNLYSCKDLLYNIGIRQVGGNVTRSVTVDVSGLDTSRAISMNGMLGGFIWEIEGLESLNTGKVTDMTSMMNLARGNVAKSIDLRGWDTGRVKSMAGMFRNAYYSGRLSLDMRGWDTRNVTDMSEMFYYTQMEVFDLTGWDMSNVRSMEKMFYYERKATEVIMDGPVNPDVDTADMFGGITTTGVFRYNPVYDYSRIISALPATWIAQPMIF